MIEVRKPNPIPKMLMTRVTALPGIRYIPSLYALPFEHKGKHFNSVHRILYAVSNFYPPLCPALVYHFKLMWAMTTVRFCPA